ncbi:8322_t:CDS:2 [Scutellospora calospora]|uniref:8322_t:CDS:1 n=1 Tax=Scutellospora calospora TaxID=85575 RepID=A0ACA9K671_9GLOM|nr:8322_t:CDS:2 [Scutellospora calospora]
MRYMDTTKLTAENTELKDRVTKLEQMRTLVTINNQNASSTKDKKSIITVSTPEPIHSSTQIQKEPVTSIMSSQQDIVDDNLASSLEFIEMIHKENIAPTISYERKKEQGLIQEITAGNSQDDTSPFTQVHDSISQEYATEILLSSGQEKSSIFQNIAHLYEKACDAEHESIKANQAEILCWSNFIIVLDKSLDELMVRDKDNSSDDLPKTDVDEKTLPKIEVSTLTIPQPKLQISAELAQSKASYAPPKLFPFKRKLSKEMRNPVINKLTSHFTDSPKLDKNCSIDTEGEHQTDSYWVLGSHCPLCRENHMSLNGKWWLDSRNKNTYYLHCTNLKEPGIPYDDVLKAYSSNLELIQELKTQSFTIPIPWNNALILSDKSIVVEA